MSGHKSEDYKLSAVLYYLNNENVSMDDVCEIFNCKKPTLKTWVDRYIETNEIKRHNRLTITIINEYFKLI